MRSTCCGPDDSTAGLVEVSAPFGTITYAHSSRRYLLEFGTTMLCFTAEAFDNFMAFVETAGKGAPASGEDTDTRSIAIACGMGEESAHDTWPSTFGVVLSPRELEALRWLVLSISIEVTQRFD